MRIYVPPLAAFLLIAGFCSTGAGAASAAGNVPVDEAMSTTALALSAPTVVYGDEQADQLTVTVSGTGGTPTGMATVSAGTTAVCVITLAAGTGTCALTADELPVGGATLTAAYGGDVSFDPSSSAAVALGVEDSPPSAPVSTTTTLSLAEADVAYGDEQAESISVTVAVLGGGGPAAGSVTVSSGVTSICEFVLTSSGTGSCALRAMSLVPGSATLTATYAGDATFGSSVSAAQPVAVGQEPTTTTVSLSAGKVTYGAEQDERISATVRLAYGGTPAGPITLKDGSTAIRVIALAAGEGSYTLAAASLPGGTARLTAFYAGDADYAGSASAAQKLAVARASSRTTAGLSAGNVTYGAEQHERISVTVKPAHGGTATGAVTIRAGGTRVCVITLRSARGACTVPATGKAAGRYAITARYDGSGDIMPSAAAARTFSVARASSRTVLSLSAASVQYGSEGSATISVRIAPRYAGTPAGTVTVKAGRITLAAFSLKAGKGSYTLSRERLAAGTYTLVAAYGGNSDFEDSASAGKTLTVTSPPPPAPACYPLTSGGNCYEPGEYCPDRDHGLTGIAGDGEAIICADNDGWRWEPLANGAIPVQLLLAAFSAEQRRAGPPGAARAELPAAAQPAGVSARRSQPSRGPTRSWIRP